jgi:antitoxin component YwqK of YwqJK toxin-antitoxin module
MPAVIYSDGKSKWYKNGKLHRDNDMPAIITADGSQEWYKNGKFTQR